MATNINGFCTKSDHSRLFQFLNKWEMFVGKFGKADESALLSTFPNLQKATNGLVLHKAQFKTIRSAHNKPSNSDVWMSDGARIINFIRHLRNSIAHAYIRKKRDKIIITDKQNQNSADLNCYACIDNSKFFEIIDAIIE